MSQLSSPAAIFSSFAFLYQEAVWGGVKGRMGMLICAAGQEAGV